MQPESIIVGLGNPGREYRHNRHNVGFMAVNRLATRMDLRFTRKQDGALVVQGQIGEHPVLLAKPQGYMNRSGGPVASLVRFYQVPLDRLLVCYDEMDLPLGALRLRPEGGSAGHNGMKSIIESLGSQEFPRLRLGIGRPPGKRQGAAHVLKDFSGDEAEIVDLALEKAAEAIEAFVLEGVQAAMNKHNPA